MMLDFEKMEFKNIFYLILLYVSFSCNNLTHIKDNEISEVIIFPQENNLVKFSTSKKKKIITYIDGTCSSCLNELERWNEFIKNDSLDHSRFLVKIFVYTNNPKFLMHVISSNMDIPMSTIHFDKDNSFLLLNNIFPNIESPTFLLDADNHVILRGSPIENDDIRKSYFDFIGF